MLQQQSGSVGVTSCFGTILDMERNWCCPEFQEHASNASGKSGFRVGLVWRGRRPFSCYLLFRLPDQPLDHAVVEIKFCPWCSCNLREQYASGSV